MDKTESSQSTSDKTSVKVQSEVVSTVSSRSRKARGECGPSRSSSHTQYFKREKYEESFKRVNVEDYLSISESISSSDTFGCIHTPYGKQYTEKGLLKRNILKNLDPIPKDPKWISECPLKSGWEITDKIVFLINSQTVDNQKERLLNHLNDLNEIAAKGYNITVLDNFCFIMDYLIETIPKNPERNEIIMKLLQNLKKPVILNKMSDIVTYFDEFRNFMGFFGYLLMRLEDDAMFDEVSEGILWHMSTPDKKRPSDAAKVHHTLAIAAPVLYQTTARMLALASAHRYPTFLKMALILVCESEENCIELMKENLLENIFYRFNPYFPYRELPVYDINPADPQDMYVKLGDSSVHLSTTLSVLLVLVKTIKDYIDEDPKRILLLPCLDDYSQRCFLWAYRYECRARDHRHQRTTMTVIAHALIYCYKNKLRVFSTILMQDVMSLAVRTEFPFPDDWTRSVSFNISQQDVRFKNILVQFSVNLIKMFPYNKFMVEYRYWLLGLAYLIDPGLCYLRKKWTSSLYAEVRKMSIEALSFCLPCISPELVKRYGLLRRILWYIEWYSESPYEISMLYWCMRLLQATLHHRKEPERKVSVRDLFDSHGVIILMHLCYTLLNQKVPPIEKSQVVLSLCLRILTSTLEFKSHVICCVYPDIKWPVGINSLAMKMLDIILSSLEKNYIISDRWLVALLNFIWEGVIWKQEYRQKFILKDGIYKLLDVITLTRPAVQCIAMALICDVARAGDAIGQLVSWRAKFAASTAYPGIVKRGATIVTLLASIFRDECIKTGVKLDHNGVIQDLEYPITSSDMQAAFKTNEFLEVKSKRTRICYVAGDVAGSRMSKAFAILHLLSEDLEYKVAFADEAYNLYKHIKIATEDECVLVLCVNYLSLKLNEVWKEASLQNPGLLPQDNDILEEFLHIKKGWSNEIQRQQTSIIERAMKKEYDEEYSLYEFLGRVRLNIAVDGLREVRCQARSADRVRVTHSLIQDAVAAHHRRTVCCEKLGTDVIKTYGPVLDEQNLTGQNVKVCSIPPKGKPLKGCEETSQK